MSTMAVVFALGDCRVQTDGAFSMTNFLSLFTETFMAEQNRLTISPQPNRGKYHVQGPTSVQRPFHGTRADCERFVVDHCARKGFEALAVKSKYNESIAKTQHGYEAVLAFLAMLATEPETTSGDAG